METVSTFAKQHHADLTVMPEGEHWFHTEKQMQFPDWRVGAVFIFRLYQSLLTNLIS